MKNIVNKVIDNGKKILIGGLIIGGIGASVVGINSISNRGKYEVEGKLIENYYGKLIREDVTLKNTRNRLFGADYVEVREDGLKIKYRGIKQLKKMRYDGEKVPKNSPAFKEGKIRFKDIQKIIKIEEEKREREKEEEKIKRLGEPLCIKN